MQYVSNMGLFLILSSSLLCLNSGSWRLWSIRNAVLTASSTFDLPARWSGRSEGIRHGA